MELRIAEISTLSQPVPPAGEGSVEYLVSVLTEGLIERGHDVTLFASSDSKTRGRLLSPVSECYSNDPNKWDWQLYEAFQAREAFRRHDEFDVIHCHSYHHAFMFSEFVPIPVLMTVHLETGPDYLFLAERSGNCHLQFCSQYQARKFRNIAAMSIIPHGLPTAAALNAAGESRGDDLVFLGRFHPDKGPLEAIRIARQLGRRLLMAAPESDYYHSHIAPEVDGSEIVYVGELSGAQKYQFLARASALLYPIQRGEPFGLVLIESLMSGTPVLAPALGAVPEIVEHGSDGWLVSSDEDYRTGLHAIEKVDRDLLRHRAMDRFGAKKMVGGVEALMMHLVNERRHHG